MGKVAAIDSTGGNNYARKGHDYDPYLRSFMKGVCGIESNWEQEEHTNSTLVIRGLGGGSQKAIKRCWAEGRPFYAIDTGYFGNGKHKTWHRVTFNALQNMSAMREHKFDRLSLQLKVNSWDEVYKPFTDGAKILVCPPSNKVMNMFGQPDAETYTNNLVNQLKELTDRPIEIRMKPIRSERVTGATIQEALQDDVHCLITYNSIAATEALMEGKAAITLGPNSAQLICETDLANIETPHIPTEDEMYAYLTHLSYSQFTQGEMEDGTAWRILQETQQ
jgi:hypothetical protein|tara:strand:- start:290 stop:1123 length:834 start_codon:yes stop_codon:yes gene_type:complete